MYDENTPILLAPRKREELLRDGQKLFNEAKFFEAHEAWEGLWKLERERDKIFLQALIVTCGHFVQLQKGLWSPAKSLAHSALGKFSLAPHDPIYVQLDVEPLIFALKYNQNLLHETEEVESLSWNSFIVPQLFEKNL